MYRAEVTLRSIVALRPPAGRSHTSAVITLLNLNNLSGINCCKNANIPKLRRAKVRNRF
jgi:hypothetical protein